MIPLEVLRVDSRQIDAVWGDLSPFLASGLEKGNGELDISHLRLLAVRGDVVLFAVKRGDALVGAVAVEFCNYPNYRCASVVSIGGRQMFASRSGMDQLKAWCKEMGASKIQGYCDDAISRLWKSRLGMRKTYTLMRDDI